MGLVDLWRDSLPKYIYSNLLNIKVDLINICSGIIKRPKVSSSRRRRRADIPLLNALRIKDNQIQDLLLEWKMASEWECFSSST